MKPVTCPKCGQSSLFWDSRSNAYLCLATGCDYSARPSPPESDQARIMAVLNGKTTVRLCLEPDGPQTFPGTHSAFEIAGTLWHFDEGGTLLGVERLEYTAGGEVYRR